MSDRHILWSREPWLRLAGCVAALVGGTAMYWLFHSAARGVPADPSLLQALAAAIGFLGLSLGAALLVLGVHIFDQVELSERWKRRQVHPLGSGKERQELAAAIRSAARRDDPA